MQTEQLLLCCLPLQQLRTLKFPGDIRLPFKNFKSFSVQLKVTSLGSFNGDPTSSMPEDDKRCPATLITSSALVDTVIKPSSHL